MSFQLKLHKKSFYTKAVFFCVLVAIPAVFFLSSHEDKPRVTIEMTERGFVMNDISIQQGETIVFYNADTVAHWPATSLHPMHTMYPDADIRLCGTPRARFMFDACEPIEPGESWEFTFHEAGQWIFHDHLAPRYSGRIKVESVSGYRASFWYSMQRIAAHIYVAMQHPIQTFTTADSLPGMSSVRSGATGLLVGTKVSLEDLVSSKNYESESIFHYTFDDDIEIRKVLYQLGVRRTMEKILEESNNGGGFECHAGAHFVGRASYDVFGIDALKECTPSCNSGCYHGVMEALFWEYGSGDTTERINTLCGDFSSKFEYDNCFHGAGHGLLAVSGYDLPAAIGECQSFGDQSAVRECYGGVFMENVRAAAGFSADPNGHATSWLSLSDPFFPCNFFAEEDVVQACFSKQSEWMLHLFSQDYTQVAQLCSQAPDAMITSCFKSLGSDIASDSLRDSKTIQTLCSVAEGQNYTECIVGASNVAIDFWGSSNIAQTVSFCAAFDDGHASESCFKRLIERVPDIFSDSNEQIQVCALLENPPLRAECELSIE